MPLDHFVSQVHLRQFYSPALAGQRMYGFRKRDSLIFQCRSRDVCRIENGSTNCFLANNRAVEDFLKTIEPYYNQALTSLRVGNPTHRDVYVISGFVAYVTSCSPAAMRLGVSPLQGIVRATMEILELSGKLPETPEVFAGKSVSDLLRDGDIQIKIDKKYPQAIWIQTILERINIFGNSDWDLITNNDRHSPFFTSDFPAAIETSPSGKSLDRIVPLAPDFAVVIHPNRLAKGLRLSDGFPKFNARAVVANSTTTKKMNEAIARCAEDFVYFRDLHSWVKPFLQKHSSYQVETDVLSTDLDKGILSKFQMRDARR